MFWLYLVVFLACNLCSLSEYRGEQLSERAVLLYIHCYAHWNLNYAFQTGRDQVIDATCYGSMARYANSGSDQDVSTNLRARLRQVNPSVLMSQTSTNIICQSVVLNLTTFTE